MNDEHTDGEVIAKPPRKFGFLSVKPAEPEEALWLPPELRRLVVDLNVPQDEAAAKYGKHKLRILKGTSVWNQTVEPGDEVEVTGNIAVALINQRQAESLDPRRTREVELMAEARRLKIPLADADNPAFSPAIPPTPRRRFVTDWKNKPEGP